MIAIIESQQTDDAQAFATSQREIASAIANVKSMDSQRNVEILQALNEVFDSLEGSLVDATSTATSLGELASV